MSFKNLSISTAGDDKNVCIITLNRPPENRPDSSTCQELIAAYRNYFQEKRLRSNAGGAVVLTSSSSKFFTTGLDLDERETNIFASTDGFYPLLHTVLDFSFPTIACVTGHVFGGACLLTLAHDYRFMNSRRGFWQMPPVNLGLHHDGMGSLVRSKLGPRVARKVLLEEHKYKSLEAQRDGIVDVVAEPEQMLAEAVRLGETWKGKATMGVYGMLRDELWGEARRYYAQNSYVHRKETSKEPKVKL